MAKALHRGPSPSLFYSLLLLLHVVLCTSVEIQRVPLTGTYDLPAPPNAVAAYLAPNNNIPTSQTPAVAHAISDRAADLRECMIIQTYFPHSTIVVKNIMDIATFSVQVRNGSAAVPICTLANPSVHCISLNNANGYRVVFVDNATATLKVIPTFFWPYNLTNYEMRVASNISTGWDITINWDIHPYPEDILHYQFCVFWKALGNSAEVSSLRHIGILPNEYDYVHTAISDYDNVTAAPTDGTIVLTGLKPFTVYNVVVTTILRDRSFIKQQMFFATSATQPQTPLKLNQLYTGSSRSILLLWKPSQPVVALVRTWHLAYTDLMDPRAKPLEMTLILGINVGPAVNMEAPSLSCIDGGLVAVVDQVFPYSNYSIMLQEETPQGLGPPSLPGIFTTASEVQPALERPQQLDIVNNTIIRIKWQPPQRLYGEIRYYQVHIYEVSINDSGVGPRAPRGVDMVLDTPPSQTHVDIEAAVLYGPVGNTAVFAVRTAAPTNTAIMAEVRTVNSVGTSVWSSSIELHNPLLNNPNPQQHSRSDSGLAVGDKIAIGVSISAFFLVMLALGLLLFRRQRTLLQYYKFVFPARDDWHMDRSAIVKGRVLGKGAFGVVYQACFDSRKAEFTGHLHDIFPQSQGSSFVVAVKMCNREDVTALDKRQFVDEANHMKAISTPGHPNIVCLIGTCMQDTPLAIVVEYCSEGDLRELLQACRPQPNRPTKLSRHDLISMAHDVAAGMAYVATKGIVHRDLACRNCLVTENLTVKVTDFGMSRDIHYQHYYRKDGEALLPVRWMAPECLLDGVFTELSDVYSYGVLLWEIYTFGCIPYPALSNQQVYEKVIQGHRLEAPPRCPVAIYAVMKACIGSERPTFAVLEKGMRLLMDIQKDTPDDVILLEVHNEEQVTQQKIMPIYHLLEMKKAVMRPDTVTHALPVDSFVFADEIAPADRALLVPPTSQAQERRKSCESRTREIGRAHV